MQYVGYLAGMLVAAALYKWAINRWCARRMRTYLAEHAAFIKDALAEQGGWDFPKKIAEIKALVLKSGVSDQHLSWMEPIGLGHAKHQQMSVLDNMTYLNRDVQGKVIDIFHRAEGVFESRCREAFSPFYWTEAVIHLPSNVLRYLGVPDGSVWLRLANVIAWVITVPGFLLTLPDFADWQRSVSHFLVRLTTP